MSATNLIDSVIAAHGGLDAYHSLTSITVRFTMGGMLLLLKQRPGHLDITATISTREPKTILRGASASADEEWVYTPRRVWKQSISTGSILESRDDPRPIMKAEPRETPWDDLGWTYFVGYALWQYFNFPYLLKRDDIKTRELEPHTENGDRWRLLKVDFPPQDVVASHCDRQTFYFDEKFALRRHGYWPDVVGRGSAARGETGPGAENWAAHYSYDEVEVGGLRFPTLRRVVVVGTAQDGSVQPVFSGPGATRVLLVVKAVALKGEDGSDGASWALSEVARS